MEMSNIERVITIEEFRKQNRKDSMWIIIDKKVIDITSY
jgi:cytochrome b involved in lipid metabolism